MQKRIHIVFVAQAVEAWLAVHSVYEACRRDPRFRTTVVLVPARYRHANQSEWSWPVRALLETNAIPFVQGATEAGTMALGWDRLAPDVIFLPNGYDETRPPGFGVEELASVARLAYVPYGLDIYRRDARMLPPILFNERIHQRAWRVFSRSPGHKAFFDRHGRGSHNVVVSGHPRLDLARRELLQEDWVDPFSRAAPVRLVWAPHWTLKDEGWSTFLRFRDVFVDVLRQQPDVQIVLRPHPLLLGALVHEGRMARDQVDGFRDELDELPNAAIYEGGGCDGLFRWSTALISDCSSFLFEYLPVDRPILYTARSPEDAATNEDELVRPAFHLATEAPEVLAFLEMLRRGEDHRGPARRQTLVKACHRPDGHTGERIRDYLAAQLAVEAAVV